MPRRSKKQQVGNVAIYLCIAYLGAISLYLTFIAV